MSSTKREHYFLPGRKSKNGGPGILVVEGQYKFRKNKANKEKKKFIMYCVQQNNPEFGCKARAVVATREDGSFFMHSCDGYHNHLVNRAEITAEELKQRMAEIVRSNPVEPVGEAIKAVKLQAAEEFGDDDDKFNEIVAALGSHHALELRMLRVRDSVIGRMPRNRDSFDPNYFLKKIFGKNHKVEVMDSNKLPDNWEDIISKSNPDSHYRWEKLDDNLRAHEDDIENAVNEDEDIPSGNADVNDEGADMLTSDPSILDSDVLDGPEPPPPASKKLPKRILAYSSRKLLNLFSRCKRGSVDGTFKSSCKMWKQHFIFMLKDNSHWIPVVWGWLPDKTETSYKVH